MNPIICFDLDDTLITNDIDKFLIVYLKQLSTYVQSVAPEKFISELLTATDGMIKNTLPDRTLEQVFDESFYPAIGKSKEELRYTIQSFYDDVFPTFKYLTEMRPEAVEIVHSLIKKGTRVVVATNPLFPRKAVLHRLDWAGLPADEVPFSLITTYESFHYAKPQPAYFAEILAQLGWPDEPVLMVGNSYPDDIQPFEKLGYPSFWLNGHSELLELDRHRLSVTGSLNEILPWVERMIDRVDQTSPSTPARLVAILQSTPAALETLTRHLDNNQWMRSEGMNWCLLEVLCHLRDVESEIYAPRVKRLLIEENPTFQDMDASRWSTERGYLSQDGRQALKEFTQNRIGILKKIIKLDEDQWKRPAFHSKLGNITLFDLVVAIATHDQEHIRQASRLTI